MLPSQFITDLNNSTLQQSVAVPFLSNIALPSFLDMCLNLQNILSHSHNALNSNQPITNSMSEAIKFRSKTLSYKRSYSPESLERAVRDVRSGRLGTRRASLVYGIPRSTLRNKVYRMDCNEGLVKPKSSNLNKYLMEAGTDNPKSDDSRDTTIYNSNELKTLDDEKAIAAKTICDAETTTNTSENSLWPTFFKDEKTLMTPDFMTLFEELSRPSHSIASLFQGTSKNINKTDDSNCWKKARPKRGHYRKYDKAALDKAVNSVRLGEMSVHKAGSVYGVPHSTLEYKVKERNLLKKKKTEENLTK
ncbi:unnamed protein product [Auanema sp. JU1783]|nr:unnamed protein product [Auanema sp. JU1783]